MRHMMKYVDCASLSRMKYVDCASLSRPRHAFSKVLTIVAFDGKCVGGLTFANFCLRFFPSISAKAHASQSDREGVNVGGESGVEGGGEGKGSQEKEGAVAEEEAATVMMEVGEGRPEFLVGGGCGVEKVGGSGDGVGQVGGGEESAMGEGGVNDGMRAGVGEDVQVVGAEGGEGGKVRGGRGGGGGGRGGGDPVGGGEGGGDGGEDLATVWGMGDETNEDVQGRHAKRYVLPCSRVQYI